MVFGDCEVSDEGIHVNVENIFQVVNSYLEVNDGEIEEDIRTEDKIKEMVLGIISKTVLGIHQRRIAVIIDVLLKVVIVKGNL